MSGHSKWATIKRQKGVADIKRGQTFTKIANAITIAVRAGGGITNPDDNFHLRLAIEKARGVNMPKENIRNAIARAVGGEEKGVEEVVYEGFAPGGISVIVEAATENSQRTLNEIKNIFSREEASFGQPGSVAHQFTNKGRIVINKEQKSLDEIFDLAVESGAEDVEEDGETVSIYTSASDLSRVKEALLAKGLNISETELVRVPIVFMSIEDSQKRDKVINFLHKLEELDDVQKVYSNLK